MAFSHWPSNFLSCCYAILLSAALFKVFSAVLAIELEAFAPMQYSVHLESATAIAVLYLLHKPFISFRCL